MKTGSEPVGGAVVEEDLPQFQPRELAGHAAESVQAIAAVEAGGKQFRGRAGPSVDERPDGLGVVPELVVLRPGHGDDDLLGAARWLRRGRFSFTIHWPGLRSVVHLRIFSCGKKKNDEEAAGRIPGTSIPAIR